MRARDDNRRRWSYTAGFILAVVCGGVLGVVFSAAATMIRLVQGSQPFDSHGVSFGSAIALYLVGFLLAGAIAGALNPIARSRAGAILLGILAVVPISLGAVFLLSGELVPPDGGYAFAAVVFSILFGGGCGYLFWNEFVKVGV